MTFSRDELFDRGGFDAAIAETANTLPLFREALKTGREVLERRFWEGLPIAQLVAAQAWLVDQLLLRAWALVVAKPGSAGAPALVAVGGYGRGELHPYSDVDVMVLLERGDAKSAAAAIAPFIRFLWDLGLDVGHSVRTVKQCVAEAKDDLTVATNLMESRLLAGDPELFRRMRAATHASRIWPSKKFFAAKWQEQKDRHAHFDDTGYNLEPNMKEGPGGLRDIQMIAWVTQRHYDTVSLHDLVTLNFLREDEYRALLRGRNFLWQVRAGVHYLAGRREDRLLFDHQRALANRFDYQDKRGILAVEQFMKRYYRAVKELSLLNEILLQHFQEAILAPRAERITSVNRRFQLHSGFLEVTHTRVFERAPFAMLELFLILAQHPECKGVRASTIRLLRANLHRIDNKFRKDLACRSLFMEILRQPRGITLALRRMNAYGVLGAYLPVFGKVVGQMQHDLFHVYTVDEHTLFVLRNIRRFTVPNFRHEFPFASELIQRVVKPERLYLAALFHDIAKGRGGDHSELGEQEAARFGREHLLSDYDTRFICWLVRHHLLMSWTSQHKDITDPEVVLEFAKKVGDQEHLDNLYLLTVADMRGTSPKVWNEWKGRLLWQLYSATTRALLRGVATPIDLEAHVADLRAEAERLLADKGIAKGALERHWAEFDEEYFLGYDGASLAWHAQMIAGTPPEGLPVVATRYQSGQGGTEFLIFAPDRADLFVVLTAGFDRLNLSIVDARIHTTKSGRAVDSFVVLDHGGQPIRDARSLAQLQKAMREQLLDPKPGRELRAGDLPRQLKHFPIETRVSFGAVESRDQTAMEVVTQDRPGLLYGVARALRSCNVNLAAAKVATYGERAEDVFFLTARDGGPVSDPQTLARLEAAVYANLEPARAENPDLPRSAQG